MPESHKSQIINKHGDTHKCSENEKSSGKEAIRAKGAATVNREPENREPRPWRGNREGLPPRTVSKECKAASAESKRPQAARNMKPLAIRPATDAATTGSGCEATTQR